MVSEKEQAEKIFDRFMKLNESKDKAKDNALLACELIGEHVNNPTYWLNVEMELNKL